MGGSVLLVVGTRPEAIKLAPVALALREDPTLVPVVVTTGQHPEMADEALAALGVTADRRLELPPRGPDQADLVAALLPALSGAVAEVAPVAVVVQGDTASALAGALAGFWAQVPVVHVEAGLRTASIAEPFPEEGYRRMLTQVASLHLAPTPKAAARLRREGVDPRTVTCTGNTVVDAARICAERHPGAGVAGLADHDGGPRRLAALTVHRRESWGEPLRRILHGARALVDTTPDLRLVVPAHPNPIVRDAVDDILGDHDRITVTAPLPYPSLVWLLAHADVVLTDSGGIQEEAPTFGTPVVVLRDTTERPEAVAAGAAWLVGTDSAAIRHRAAEILAGPPPRRDRGHRNPFGDGQAAGRVVAALRARLADEALPEPWRPPAGTPGRRTADLTAADRASSVIARIEAAKAPGPARPDAPDADRGWARRLETVGSTGRVEPTVRPGGPVISPPSPSEVRRRDDTLGAVVEVRRGGQVVRHLPGLAPILLDPSVDPWRWWVRQVDGPLWVETALSPVDLEVPGGRVVVRDGAVCSRWDPRTRSTEVTVLSGHAEVRPTEGDPVALGPRQRVTVGIDGDVAEDGRADPAELDEDAWIQANRALSHDHPVAARLATDPLLVLSDVAGA